MRNLPLTLAIVSAFLIAGGPVRERLRAPSSTGAPAITFYAIYRQLRRLP